MSCKAELHIGDDHGDNRATMHCELEDGHSGPHVERFFLEPRPRQDAHDARVEWFGDDREERAPFDPEKLECVGCGLLSGDEPTVGKRPDGLYRCNDCQQKVMGRI